MDFSGTYYVVSSPHFDEEYLRLTGTPYVTLRQNKNGRETYPALRKPWL